MFREAYKEIKTSLEEVLEQKNWALSQLKIEEPREIADLATPISFELSSKINKKPIEIAKELIEELRKKELKNIEKIKSKKPGYINFFIEKSKLENYINKIINQKRVGTIDKDKGKIIIEHTSANPTGPLHIGHLRNAVIGDTLNNILKRSGYQTETQYYLNDLGKQMAILLYGINKYGLDNSISLDKAVGKIYSKTNKEEIDEKEIKQIIKRLENKDEEQKEKLDKVVDKCFIGIKKSLKKLDIEHDKVIKESKFLYDGSIDEVFEQLKKHIKMKDGAAQIEFEDIDKELVLKREDNTSVYALRDLAYHKWKSNQSKNNIDVLGSDHKLYSKQLKNTLKLLDVIPPEVIIFEFVSLPSGEMSTRKGEFVSIRELFEEVKKEAYKEVDKRREGKEEWKQKIAREVAKGAIKYDFIKVAPNKPISFDYEKAVSFKQQGAPFIQYSHARASNILKKSKKEDYKIYNLENDVSQELAKKISKFTYIIEKSGQKRKPHLLAEYLFEVASKFNEFYRDIPVLDSEGKQKETKLALVKASKKTLKEGIKTLGFKAPNEM